MCVGICVGGGECVYLACAPVKALSHKQAVCVVLNVFFLATVCFVAGDTTVDQSRPVCTTGQSQTAAFDLLVMLCTGCKSNLFSLCKVLTKLFYESEFKLLVLVSLSFSGCILSTKVLHSHSPQYTCDIVHL